MVAAQRGEHLKLAILGALRHTSMHGYELRQELTSALGVFRALSFGTLYPALRTLTEQGLISSQSDASGRGSGRKKIVYTITEAGKKYLAETLAVPDAAAWDDSGFDVRFTLFSETDPTTRLRILESRRSRLQERLDSLRDAVARTTRRVDAYTAELARHGLDQAAREVAWLESVIDTERGTPGAFDYTTPDSDDLPEGHDKKENL